jgi:hypothetical protein
MVVLAMMLVASELTKIWGNLGSFVEQPFTPPLDKDPVQTTTLKQKPLSISDDAYQTILLAVDIDSATRHNGIVRNRPLVLIPMLTVAVSIPPSSASSRTAWRRSR